MTIPFTKAHGARNDFLLTWSDQAPPDRQQEAAVAICDRHTGVGADGWILVQPGAIHLYNADGSVAEVSGNGTRCAAAFLIDAGEPGPDLSILTGAGLKHLRLTEHDGNRFVFEMNMGTPRVLELHSSVEGATLLDVGNPQCAVFVDDFNIDWRERGAALERHSYFPNRTNVSFVCPVDRHTIAVRIWERGVGETMSSGTGCTGAAAAALARGLVESPVTVNTPAGPLRLRWEGEQVILLGPAEITSRGEFYWDR